MRNQFIGVSAVGLLSICVRGSVIVPGSSCPWLAGMPSGTQTSSGDRAPNQSAVLQTDVLIVGGQALWFNVSGSVRNGPGTPTDPPDGNGLNVVTNNGGREFGMSNIIAPINSLLGVFLSDSRPDLSGAPASLDFSELEDREFLSLTPALQQVFFIGNGRTAGGLRQDFVAPQGATRLFFGSLDAFGWDGNAGQFTVGTVVVPAPGVASVVTAGLALGVLRRTRRGEIR